MEGHIEFYHFHHRAKKIYRSY